MKTHHVQNINKLVFNFKSMCFLLNQYTSMYLHRENRLFCTGADICWGVDCWMWCTADIFLSPLPLLMLCPLVHWKTEQWGVLLLSLRLVHLKRGRCHPWLLCRQTLLSSCCHRWMAFQKHQREMWCFWERCKHVLCSGRLSLISNANIICVVVMAQFSICCSQDTMLIIVIKVSCWVHSVTEDEARTLRSVCQDELWEKENISISNYVTLIDSLRC